MRTPRFTNGSPKWGMGEGGLSEERSVPGRLRDPEVAVRAGGGDAPAGCPLEKSGLDEVRLVEVLEGSAVLPDRGRDRSDADGSAAKFLDDRRQDAAVHLVEAVLVD